MDISATSRLGLYLWNTPAPGFPFGHPGLPAAASHQVWQAGLLLFDPYSGSETKRCQVACFIIQESGNFIWIWVLQIIRT